MPHGVVPSLDPGRKRETGTRSFEVPGGNGTIRMAVLTSAHVDDGDVTYALERLQPLLDRVSAPVLFARLKLSLATDPARDRPALAEATLDVGGDLVRAHVAGHGMREAADLLARRLADRLEHRARRREDLHTRGAGGRPGEWRHGDLPRPRPDYFDRPPEDRQVVRQKSFAVEEITPEEAVFDMELADYDFYLFRDLASGQDAMVEASDDGSYRLTLLRPRPVEEQTDPRIEMSDHLTPELTVEQAIERLDISAEPRVFFLDAGTGRASVVYRRYDGHYGLVSAEEA